MKILDVKGFLVIEDAFSKINNYKTSKIILDITYNLKGSFQLLFAFKLLKILSPLL